MRRSRLAGLALLLVVLGAAVFAWRWEQRGPGRPSVSGAVGRLRTSTTVAPTARSLQPRSGVYVYKASGTESLSFLATSQSQGPTEPGTVMVGRESSRTGCWSFRIDYNSFHHQSWTRCATNGKLTEAGGTADQRFDFVTFKVGEHSRTTCDPPFVVADLAAAPGTTWPVHCTGRSDTTKATFTQTGTATLAGRDDVEVAGARVPAWHTRERLRLSGGQTGEVKIDIWFARNGLPLQEQHVITVLSPAPAPLGHVKYTEKGTWRLTSMTPRT